MGEEQADVMASWRRSIIFRWPVFTEPTPTPITSPHLTSQVKTKIKKAYCPPKVVDGNPCLAYVQHIVLPWCDAFDVERNEANGGNK